MISSKNLIMSQKRRIRYKKMTKFDCIFDTKEFILCVVYNETVDKKSFENLSNKFVTLQTKEICQSFFESKIVDNSKNARKESINTDKNEKIA